MTISLIDTMFFQLSIMSELAESFQSTPELNTSIKYNHQELMEELDRMNRELKEMKESVLKTSGKFRFSKSRYGNICYPPDVVIIMFYYIIFK